MSTEAVVPDSMRRAYVGEGTFLAHPLSFPEVTRRVDPDASRITALAATPRGVLIGTSGTAAHLCEASLKPPAGYVYDYGPIPAATGVVAIGWQQSESAGRYGWAVTTEARGGALVRFRLTGYGGDGIQEWGFRPPEVEAIWRTSTETVLDATFSPRRGEILCLTNLRLVCIDPGTGAESCAFALSSSPILPRLGHRTTGEIVYADGTGALWTLAPEAAEPIALAAGLPYGEGAWGWCALPDGQLIVASPGGELHLLGRDGAWGVGEVAPKAPVQTLSALPDGRLYGVCGTGIGQFFSANPSGEQLAPHGVITAVLGVKRYGYLFGASTVGADGEIYFGEADRGGHLFIYFPPQPDAPALLR